MNETKTIERVTLIQGENAALKSDDEIFKLISKLEQQKKTLEVIENKPKKLKAKIDAIQGDIDRLVEFVDSRE